MTDKELKDRLPEFVTLNKLIRQFSNLNFVQETWGEATDPKRSQSKLPITSLVFGSMDPQAPTLAFFGGFHGLERIGTQVVLSLLKSFCHLQSIDKFEEFRREKIRIIFVPLVNPIGMLNHTRSNAHGVDLMRNAPVEAEDATPLVGGHRFSPRLPWFRGHEIQSENKAVFDLCRKWIFKSEFALSIDCHSGFGLQDQIWFPYAKTQTPFFHLPEFYAFYRLFEKTHPHHFYKFEPQAKNYTTHGDVWDFMYDEYRKEKPTGQYIPLALEMGSWLWVRKNPIQLFSLLGPYNPTKPHRMRRALRRHYTFFDFCIRAVSNHKEWASLTQEKRQFFNDRGLKDLYGLRSKG